MRPQVYNDGTGDGIAAVTGNKRRTESRGQYLGWNLTYRTYGPLATRWAAACGGVRIRAQCLEAIARGIEAQASRT